ncbi:unnamed protein product [Rotaria sp. Silwood1]|nr:unnamed protein product [Rotaria sp. Silwood1]
MEHLFTPVSRTVNDIGTVRRSLKKDYNEIAQDRLQPLLNKLQKTNIAKEAAHQIIRLVLVDFEYMNNEEKRIYRRQLILGFQSYDAQRSDSITAQLIRYTLELISKQDTIQNTLIYALVRVICILEGHPSYCHNLFNNTPEIFILSTLLVRPCEYVLAFGDLRLCKIILNAERVEHKYAIVYLLGW